MQNVQWLTQSNLPCEATLASDEMAQWTPDVPCESMAEVHITYHKLRAINSCHHHYITRTADRGRKILSAEAN